MYGISSYWEDFKFPVPWEFMTENKSDELTSEQGM